MVVVLKPSDAPDWRKYEKQILERLTALAGGDDKATIIFDHRLSGRYSKVDRQLDVYVEGSFAGDVERGKMAVDCKCLGRKVHVKDVEAFIGLVEDVGTDFGLMVTTEGYSEGARNRAKAVRGVRVEIVPYEELADWEPEVLFCPICTDMESDRAPGPLYIDPVSEEVPGAELVQGVGRCWTCSAISMRCNCGTLNTLLESDEGDWVECEGGCGIEWKVQVELDSKGLPEGETWEFREGGKSTDA